VRGQPAFDAPVHLRADNVAVFEPAEQRHLPVNVSGDADIRSLPIWLT
jgi:hypothetical protein